MIHIEDRPRQILDRLIEQWHNDHPNDRIHSAMIDYLREYFNECYVAGYDDYRIELERIVEKLRGRKSANLISVNQLGKELKLW